jgi:hypothetical protein
LKPDSKQKYLQVEQRQLSYGFIFTICLFIYLSCNIKVNAWKGQYKICDKKIDMKFSISSLVSTLQLWCQAWYGSLRLISGSI